MKVLLINGSPHKNGCTSVALREVEETLNKEGIETENYWIGSDQINSCIGCGKCKELRIAKIIFKNKTKVEGKYYSNFKIIIKPKV